MDPKTTNGANEPAGCRCPECLLSVWIRDRDLARRLALGAAAP